MRRWCTAAALAAVPILASGCVAAAVPVAVGGVIARGKLRDSDRAAEATRAQTPPKLKTRQGDAAVSEIKGRRAVRVMMDALPAPDGVVPESSRPALARPVAGTGAAAPSSLQTYPALSNYLSVQAAARRRGEPLRSVVLAPGATLDAPVYLPCEARPLAAVFDLDEDAEGSGDPDARWRRWVGDGTDSVVAVPGAIEGVAAARREGVTVIFTSARAPSGAAGVAALLDRLGFGPQTPGETLMLRGAEGTGDAMRQAVAARYCVIALVGDSRGEFSDLFDRTGDTAQRPVAVTETMVAPLWGAGWFLLPNPVRSTITPSYSPKGAN